MTLQSAQQHYDNMLPPEYPEDHEYTGEVYVEDESGEPTLFTFQDGQIVTVMIDEDGTEVPYAQWNGCDTLRAKADAEASELWDAELEEMQNDYY
jgi:predicted SnoaL-like aldol condensation-catalyzing enzyme